MTTEERKLLIALNKNLGRIATALESIDYRVTLVTDTFQNHSGGQKHGFVRTMPITD